jgi:hypothetical protein
MMLDAYPDMEDLQMRVLCPGLMVVALGLQAFLGGRQEGQGDV